MNLASFLSISVVDARPTTTTKINLAKSKQGPNVEICQVVVKKMVAAAKQGRKS